MHPKLTLKVPGGIGDIAWIYAKMCRRGYPVCIVPSQDKPPRSVPFLRLLPNVRKPYYGTFGAGDAAANGQLLTVPHEGEIFLSANQHLEANNRLEQFLPNDPTDFHFHVDIPLKDHVQADRILSGMHRPLVIYPSSNHNTYISGWQAIAYAKLGQALCKQWGCELVLLGAEYDRSMIDEIVRECAGLQQTVHAQVVGKDLALALAVIQRSAYFIGFQSGLGILATVLDTPSTMLLGRHLPGLCYSWAPLHQINSGRFRCIMFPGTGPATYGQPSHAKKNAWEPVFDQLKHLEPSVLFPPNEFDTVTVICDKEEITRPTVEKLLTESRGRYRVIIVDNACTGPMKNYLLKLSNEGRIRLVRIEKRVGVAQARNLGILQSKAEFVICLDDDVWVEGEFWHGELIGSMLRNGDTAMTGPCGSRIAATDDMRKGWQIYGYEDQRYFGSETQTGRNDFTLDSIPTMCVGFRRKALMDVGLFDPLFSPFQFEDADVCMKLKANGHKIRLARASVQHVGNGANSHKIAEGVAGKPVQAFVEENAKLFYERWGHRFDLLEASREHSR